MEWDAMLQPGLSNVPAAKAASAIFCVENELESLGTRDSLLVAPHCKHSVGKGKGTPKMQKHF